VTNYSGKRSFFIRKIVKIEQRSTMRQNRLNNLNLKNIEHKLLYELDTISIINKFGLAKSRKCNLKQ